MAISSRVTFVTVGTTPVAILPHSDFRKSILFTNSTGTAITLSHDPNLAAGNGLTVINQSGGLTLLYDELGTAICQAWYAISTGGGGVLGIIEGVEG